jgi:hypothetical protein
METEDEEADFCDEPVLSALNKELDSVLRTTDNRLIIFLAVLFAAAYSLEQLHFSSDVLFWGMAFCIGCGVGCTILSVRNGKQKIAEKYGLVCQVCGHRPKPNEIMLTAQVQQCRACGNSLDMKMP